MSKSVTKPQSHRATFGGATTNKKPMNKNMENNTTVAVT